MGIPLALSVFGGKGMFLMALGNVVGNFLIFSVGVKLLTWKYPMKEKLNIRKMIWNNINIAVLLGLVVYPADSCSGCVGTAAGVSVQYY